MSEDHEIADRILAKASRQIEPALSRRWPVVWHRLLAGGFLVGLAWLAILWLSAPAWLPYVAVAWATLIIASAIYIRMRVAKLATELKALEAKVESFHHRERE